MQAVELLTRVRNGRADISRMEGQLDRRLQVAEHMGADDGNDAVIRAMRAALDARRDMHRAETVAACSMLDELPELDADVLYAYYIFEGGNLDAYAQRCGYSARYIRNVKRRAEKLLMERYSEDDVRALLPDDYEE